MAPVVPSSCIALTRLVHALLADFPAHDRFVRRRFSDADLRFAERVAGIVLKLAGVDLPRFVGDYAWLCDRVMEEELSFRRTGAYRLRTFEEARREVYDDHAFMTRYMNGLLLTQVLWSNHSAVMEHYVEQFLPAAPHGYRHLEVGPGHGLLLSFAAADPRAGTVTAWDLSLASLDATRRTLHTLHTPPADLVARDLFEPLGDQAAEGQTFDTIVLSEVCEHLEDPRAALVSLRRVLAMDGRLFVNVPVNSPAPDHIYLLRSPEEAVQLVKDAGYDVVETHSFPGTGTTLERARRMASTISCVIVGRHGTR
jgi:2-polyprenyl-3-methyl-5-hydroxy-6-metoxy-1,4-benzoquinol methylase